nr:hypothetical protein SEVIR_4G113101v2 [Setaria viridis]
MVLSAPKLETLGCISDSSESDKLVFGTTIIEELDVVSFAMVGCCSIKILAISICNLSLDMVISYMRYFPCMEKLYIQVTINHLLSCLLTII